MRSNNQLGIPLPFYWSPNPAIAPFISWLCSQPAADGIQGKAQTRPKPKYTTDLHSWPIQKQVFDQKNQIPPGYGRRSKSVSDYFLLEQKGMPALIPLLNYPNL